MTLSVLIDHIKRIPGLHNRRAQKSEQWFLARTCHRRSQRGPEGRRPPKGVEKICTTVLDVQKGQIYT